MEIAILDLDNVTEQELISAICKNNQTITILQKNINALESKSNLKKKDITVTPKKIYIEDKQKEDSRQDLKDEIDYYFSMVSSYTDSKDLLGNLLTSVPSRKNVNYSNIMLGIKLELLKEIKEFEELLGEEGEKLTKDDLQEFLDVINLNKKKIELLTSMENTNVVPEETAALENNLIFVPTNGGNIRVIDEILSMPIEFLESFKGLFDSVKEGTFKNVKRFSSINNKNSGMSEVRDYQVRLVFDRIGKNDYALVTAFIKKCDNDKGYMESMNLKIKNYETQKDKIKSNLSNPEFRRIHEEYTKELYRILDNDKYSASECKTKGRGFNV